MDFSSNLRFGTFFILDTFARDIIFVCNRMIIVLTILELHRKMKNEFIYQSQYLITLMTRA